MIAVAIQERRPVYMGLPSDYAIAPVVGEAEFIPAPTSDPLALDAAVSAIAHALSSSHSACIIPGGMVSRYGLAGQALAVINACNLPFTTMFMDKCVLDETHPNYIGLYDGKLMNEQVRIFVEECDCVIGIVAMLTDFNSGSFTANIDRSKSINMLLTVRTHVKNVFRKLECTTRAAATLKATQLGLL